MLSLIFMLACARADDSFVLRQGNFQFGLNRTKDHLDVVTEGMTYTLPLDACTKPAAVTFMAEFEDHRRRLIKYVGPKRPPEGTILGGGEERLLLEASLVDDAPAFLRRTPKRFMGLLFIERERCPNSFSSR